MIKLKSTKQDIWNDSVLDCLSQTADVMTKSLNRYIDKNIVSKVWSHTDRRFWISSR